MPANYVLLERIELNASAASVTFANIPQSGYTDLKVVISARSSYSSGEGVLMRFNGSSGANYTYKQLYGAGSSAGSYGPPSSETYGFAGTMGGTNFTASTFDSIDLYIPNYTSSNNKSFSVDSVAENNSATVNQLDLIAGLWTQTAAITSITFTSYNAANFVANSTFSLYGLAAVGTTPVIAPKASGGNIDNDGTYWYHTFLTTGAFVPQQGLTCDYLIVAGGGAGASVGGSAETGGGGGAGGYRTFTSQVLTTTSYTATIGAGGSSGSAGVASSFNSSSSAGGGGGGGGAGGSGGGGLSANSSARLGGAGNTPSTSPSQGNNGGNGNSTSNSFAGGGGGAGAVGGTGSGGTSGSGGIGSFTAISGGSSTGAGQLSSGNYYFAGGGGGGGGSVSAGSGGLGGGGAGGVAGTINTGGGGGGSPSTGGSGTNGGSGIIIIRYPIA
jgi:hypothetical protein